MFPKLLIASNVPFVQTDRIIFPTLFSLPLLVCGFGGNDKNTVTAKQKDEISANEKVLDILFPKNEAISFPDSPF